MRQVCKVLVSIGVILTLVGCKTKQTEMDFWSATIQALDKVVKENTYQEGNWQINVEDKARVKEINQRSATISQVFEEENVTKTTTFSLQNINDKKRISYIYKISTTEKEKRVDQTVKIISANSMYRDYEILYTLENFQSNIYQDSSQLKGNINIDTNNTIRFYDAVPCLKEALTANFTLLTSFQKEFNVEYQKYDFVNLPEIAKDLEISEKDTQETSEDLKTTDYYSTPYSNARGYMLMSFLKIEKDFSTATFGVYNTDGKRYESKATATFEKREMDNCYNLIEKGDVENSYAVYLDGETAYLYKQSMQDQEILDAIKNPSEDNPYTVLKTTNEGF